MSYSADRHLSAATIGGVSGTYSFDEAGNLVSDTEGATTTSYTYDAASRLTQTNDGAATTYYGWDQANGWRTCQGPNASPTTANEPIVFTYTKSSGVSTSNGRLMRYQNSATSTDASYAYDASGQRTQSTVTLSGATTTTSFAYDGLTLLKLSATQGSTTWRIDYLYDEEGVPYGGVYRSPATSTSPTYFTMVTSDRGDVVELLDASGNAFASYRYDAWGLPRGSGNYATGVWTQSTSLITSALAGQIASRQVLRYAGYAYDAESGLYYCSARYYDPATRQWTSGDPAKADGEESAYQYCGGEPVQQTDPSGLSTEHTNGQVSTVRVPKGDGSSNKVTEKGWFNYRYMGYSDIYAFKVTNFYGKNNCTKSRIFRWQVRNRDNDGQEPSLKGKYLTNRDWNIPAGKTWAHNENDDKPKHPCYYVYPTETKKPEMRVIVFVGETTYYGNWVLCDLNTN